MLQQPNPISRSGPVHHQPPTAREREGGAGALAAATPLADLPLPEGSLGLPLVGETLELLVSGGGRAREGLGQGEGGGWGVAPIGRGGKGKGGSGLYHDACYALMPRALPGTHVHEMPHVVATCLHVSGAPGAELC